MHVDMFVNLILIFCRFTQILYQTVTNCLFEADKNNMASIAFPTLGCGFLNYPMNIVTDTICTCLSEFETNRPTTTLKHVFVVIFNKGEDWKHIKEVRGK